MKRTDPRLRLAPILAALGAILGCWVEDPTPDPAEELARPVPGHRPLLARTSLPLPPAPFDPAAPAVGPEDREALYARLLAAQVAGARGAGAALAAFYAVRREAGDADRALAEATDPVEEVAPAGDRLLVRELAYLEGRSRACGRPGSSRCSPTGSRSWPACRPTGGTRGGPPGGRRGGRAGAPGPRWHGAGLGFPPGRGAGGPRQRGRPR